jgi:hypothetical protein
MQYRGGVPGGAEAVPPGVPALMMIGQFDEFGGAMRGDKGREAWETGRDALADFRSKDPANLGSVVVEWGAGHFAWSTRNADYFARYLRKAADARIPDWPADAKEVVRCKVVDPASGWLSDLDLKTPGKVASHGEYTGERSRAAWHFDRELAEATTAFHAGWGKEDQFIEWADPTWVDAGVRHFFTDVRWVEDGQTFRLRPRYARTYPKTQPDGKWPRWGSAAGKEVGHSDAEIRVRVAAGPLEPVAADCLRIRFDALFPATEPVRATFLAVSAGDAKYRPTEQVGMLPRGFSGLKAGKDQSITFPQPADLKLGGEVELRATSDAGLPVSYHVAEGPAVVEGGKLRAAQVPARARLPLTVRVVAYQFGRGVEPLVKTASPVERTVRLVKQ